MPGTVILNPIQIQSSSGNVLSINENGAVAVSGGVSVVNSPNINNILGSVPLPSGASTESKQIELSSKLDNLLTFLSGALNGGIVIPQGAIEVYYFVRGNVPGSSSSDTVYTIPLGTKLFLKMFYGGTPMGVNDMSAVQLFFSSSESVTGRSFTVAFAYVPVNYSIYLNREYIGDGTKSLIMRRYRLDSVTREMAAALFGYLTFNTKTTHVSGTSTSIGTTTLTDTSKSWATNVHAGRYLVVNGINPLKIISNTSNTVTVHSNAVIGFSGAVPYEIVTFS